MSQVIKYEDRHQIRDIFIPLAVPTEASAGMTVDEANLESAYCYTGQAEPKRLFDGTDAKLVNWLINIYAKSETAPRGAKNWRIEHENVKFRAHRGVTVDGPDLILRTLPQTAPDLTQLHMPHAWREIYMDPSLLYGGLVLTTAKNGMAKTTTISAALKSRLQLFGGHANCVEDPPELPLHGALGKGMCRQIPVGVDAEGDDYTPDHGFADALRDVRREFPSITGGGTILMIGEIRDNETAAETLLAAFEGHLVLATFHSASIPHALMRLASMAGAVIGLDQARQLLAATLRACFHQKLTLRPGKEGWESGEINGRVLLVPAISDSQVAKEIEAGEFLNKIHARVEDNHKRIEALGPTANITTIRQVVGDR